MNQRSPKIETPSNGILTFRGHGNEILNKIILKPTIHSCKLTQAVPTKITWKAVIMKLYASMDLRFFCETSEPLASQLRWKSYPSAIEAAAHLFILKNKPLPLTIWYFSGKQIFLLVDVTAKISFIVLI